MGFWHTGYMEFHEPTGWSSSAPYVPPAPQHPCDQCGAVFSTRDDLDVHLFDGHATARPILTLRGRECGQSRLSVIQPTAPDDWGVRNATGAVVNGRSVSLDSLGAALSRARSGVTSVQLVGARAGQDFEFAFSIADEKDLEGVDLRLVELIEGRSLTIHAIDQFIERSKRYESARSYRDGLTSYLFGVLARERSVDSGLLTKSGEQPVYVAKFDEAVATLGNFDRAPAEAVCGLVAFHYNQFDLALRKTRSPRVARAARRFACLLAGAPSDDLGSIAGRSSLDYALSDSETEQVISWCCVALDGTARDAVSDMEAAIDNLEPSDQVKLHITAVEHYLTVGAADRATEHLAALRHSRAAESWISSVRDRMEGLRA